MWLAVPFGLYHHRAAKKMDTRHGEEEAQVAKWGGVIFGAPPLQLLLPNIRIRAILPGLWKRDMLLQERYNIQFRTGWESVAVMY